MIEKRSTLKAAQIMTPSKEEQHQSLIGKVIGKNGGNLCPLYRLSEKLGEGAHGMVYVGKELGGTRTVAIKMVRI